MKLASCRHLGRDFVGRVDGDSVTPVVGAPALGPEYDLDRLGRLELDERGRLPLAEVELRPVVPRPGKIVCLGLNYRAHVEESGRELPAYPVLFTKFSESLVGARDPIVKPAESDAVDFEAELVVVVGRRVRRLARKDALAAVAGYAVANDVTMRDFQYKSHQWLQGKTWEASTPVGPYLVTPDEVGDPSALELRCSLNGKLMQQSFTSRMIFDVPAILEHVSTFVTLEPGDLLLTGTPAGVGYRRTPRVALVPGDRVRVEINRVGVLDNPVVAEAAP